MIIINKMTNKRLNRETSDILLNIAIEFHSLCEQKGTTVLDFANQYNIHPDNFLTGKFSLAQFIRICYHLEVAPGEIIKKFYDDRTVILK